jgi:O-antigen/teichoic acid export membrane protein
MQENKPVSLKKNFAYKGLLTIANPLIAIIIFPYITRILGVENVGLVNFVDNTVSYFLLFATMGITTLGIRSIAATKENQGDLNKVFSNILGLNILFTVAVLVVYNLLIFIVPRFNECSELFFIGNAKIMFTALTIEWFFNGIEDFKYITLRTLLVRILYIMAIFLFVRSAQDYKLYFVLTVMLVVVNAVINLVHSRHYVRIQFRELFSTIYLKENILLGIYGIMTSMYLTFNVMYLGLVSTNTEVGYYTSAFKLYYLILSVFSAFTSVMLPRMSALISKGDNETFNQMINKSVEFVSIFSLPLIFCCTVLAPSIITVLCGPGYEGAVLPMRIIMPAILFVGIAQILAVQVMLPLKKDRVLLKTSIIGAVVSLLINVTVVPHLQSIGSAIVLLVSEVIVTSVYLRYSLKLGMLKIGVSTFLASLINSIPCVLICLLCSKYISNVYISITCSVVFSVIVYYALSHKRLKNLIK